MQLFRIKLSDVDYDTYDAAIIGCESKQKLEELLADGEFNEYTSLRVEYQYGFEICGQRIDTIECIGSSDYESDKEAVVFLASFNAG